MNNKLFIATSSMDDSRIELLRISIECDSMLFDRHGSADIAYIEKHFGFSTVVPEVRKNGDIRWFWRFLSCSSLYLPCGWQKDKCSRRAFAWAEILNKKVIFEEDGRCR